MEVDQQQLPSEPGPSRRQGRGASRRRNDRFRKRKNQQFEGPRFEREDRSKLAAPSYGVLVCQVTRAVPIVFTMVLEFAKLVYDHLEIHTGIVEFISRPEFVSVFMAQLHVKLCMAHRAVQLFPAQFVASRLNVPTVELCRVRNFANRGPKALACVIRSLGNVDVGRASYVPVYDVSDQGSSSWDCHASVPRKPVGGEPQFITRHVAYYAPTQDTMNLRTGARKRPRQDPPVGNYYDFPPSDAALRHWFDAMHHLARFDQVTDADLLTPGGHPCQLVQVDHGTTRVHAWVEVEVNTISFDYAWLGFGRVREGPGIAGLKRSHLRSLDSDDAFASALVEVQASRLGEISRFPFPPCMT